MPDKKVYIYWGRLGQESIIEAVLPPEVTIRELIQIWQKLTKQTVSRWEISFNKQDPTFQHLQARAEKEGEIKNGDVFHFRPPKRLEFDFSID